MLNRRHKFKVRIPRKKEKDYRITKTTFPKSTHQVKSHTLDNHYHSALLPAGLDSF